MRLLNRAPIPLHGQIPPLSERQILRALRLPHVQHIADVPERGVRDAVLKASSRAARLSSFSAVFRAFPVERTTPEAIRIQRSDTLLRSASLLRMLEGAREITLLAATLGPAWDDALDELASRREAAEAWFLDSIGTLMVDRAARLVEDRAASDMARAGLERTRRYRPGYGDFQLEAQGELCALVEAERIGIDVNEAFALLPRKSVTGVLGFRPREHAGRDDQFAEGANAADIADDPAPPMGRRGAR